jgi:hypothetical protein
MEGGRVLAMAVATGRVGYVFLVKGKLYSWQLSRKAASCPEDATRIAKGWIVRMRPDIVVTEKFTVRCRKGQTVRSITEAMARVAEDASIFNVSVERPRSLPNKYAEAEALADRFPELKSRVPKPRRLWDSEPRNTTIFEALVLALMVIDSEPKRPDMH